MRAKKIITGLLLAVVLGLLVPVLVTASDVWMGTNVSSTMYDKFNVATDRITRIDNPGSSYRVKDIDNYSAYITTASDFLGQTIDKAFYWFNKSRLAYVKFFKVTPGQNISFVFSDNQYVYCAEFDSNFNMVSVGHWMDTGDVCTLSDSAEWMMIIFRKVNGDVAAGGGTDTVITAQEISGSNLNYVLFKPFEYTFKLNGGNISGNSSNTSMKRLGVEKVTLPTPTRAGYTFGGWKSESGAIYSGKLESVYVTDIFRNTTFTAIWNPVIASKVSLDRSYLIMEQRADDHTTLKASIMPADTLDKTISWSSSDTSVATVDASGKVTAQNTGTAVIKATAVGGASATCQVYVMGFEVKVPSYCAINKSYEISVNVYNNGTEGMSGRKRILVETDTDIQVVRVGDERTKYEVVAEASAVYGQGYKPIEKQQYLINTAASTKMYYRLTPKKDITKAGDYSGNVTFSVSLI